MYGLPKKMCVLCLLSQCAYKCSFHMCCLWFCMSDVISSFKTLRARSQVFALLMLFICVSLHTMWSGKSEQLLCILPYGMLCLSAMYTLTIQSSVLCVLMVEGMHVVINVILSLMNVMSQTHALDNLSVCTVVKLCTLGAFTLGVSLVP